MKEIGQIVTELKVINDSHKYRISQKLVPFLEWQLRCGCKFYFKMDILASPGCTILLLLLLFSYEKAETKSMTNSYCGPGYR